MNLDHTIESFSSYSPEEKTDFLARLAHGLTILARDTYEVGRNGLTNPARLRTLNEIQHRVTAFLVALLKDDPKRYPDDVLARILLEHPEDLELQRQLHDEFAHLLAETTGAHGYRRNELDPQGSR